jgi:hypothetical protein
MQPSQVQYAIFPPFPFDLAPFFNAILQPIAFWLSVLASAAFMTFQAFLFFISILFFAGIVYLVGKINETNRRLNAKKKGEEPVRFASGISGVKSKRFEVAQKHMTSDNPAEWRLAIIEADALLEEMVKKMGYEGTTLGEMLKNIELSDFTTLNDAWEAHKIRNQIAHQGSTFLLTKREAKRVMQLYEKVFREFDII